MKWRQRTYVGRLFESDEPDAFVIRMNQRLDGTKFWLRDRESGKTVQVQMTDADMAEVEAAIAATRARSKLGGDS